MMSARTASLLFVQRGGVVSSGCCRGRGLEPWFPLTPDALDGGKLPHTTRKNPLISHQLDLQTFYIRSARITRVNSPHLCSIVLGPVAFKVPRRIIHLPPEYTEAFQYLGVASHHRTYRTYSRSLYISSSVTFILHATGNGETQMGVPLPNPAFTVQNRPGFPANSGRSYVVV